MADLTQRMKRNLPLVAPQGAQDRTSGQEGSTFSRFLSRSKRTAPNGESTADITNSPRLPGSSRPINVSASNSVVDGVSQPGPRLVRQPLSTVGNEQVKAAARSLLRRPSQQQRIAPSMSKKDVSDLSKPRIIRQLGGSTILTNRPSPDTNGSALDDSGRRLDIRTRKLSDGRTVSYNQTPGENVDNAILDQFLRRSLIDKRGGVDRLEGKVIEIGNSGRTKLSRFVNARNKLRAEKLAAEEDRKIQRDFALAEHKSRLDRANKTFTVGEGQQVVDSSGNVIAKGKPGQVKFLPEVKSFFESTEYDDVTGAEKKTYDVEGMNDLLQFMKDTGITDQRQALAAFQKLIEQSQPA